MKDILNSGRFISAEPITKGWSEDKKYCVTNAQGTKFLLRISPPQRYEVRKALFEMLRKVSYTGCAMNQPIEYGVDDNGVWMLYTWIDGADLEEVLPSLSEAEQYHLGCNAGAELRKIHTIPAPKGQEDWAERFGRKTDKKIEMYRECGLRFEGDEMILGFLEKNRDVLDARPQRFQHGDYHVGNMMYREREVLMGDYDRLIPASWDSEGRNITVGEVVVIDFDRFDFGDPWEEFNRIVWCAQASPLFASGMVREYFQCEPPVEFWRVLAFYIAGNTLSSIYWAIPFGQGEIDVMMKQAADVLDWYDGMKNCVPKWYVSDFCSQYIHGKSFKMKQMYDFTFLYSYGKVFKVYDDQDSGNICFGIEVFGERRQELGARIFMKFAGAPTARSCISSDEVVANLKRAVRVYRDLAHENLVRLIAAEEVGGGYAAIFEWTDAVSFGRQYPIQRARFMELPRAKRMAVYDAILDFHIHVAQMGYVAIDFYDGSLMYDFERDCCVICDVDFYAKMPCINEMGRMWGSSTYMSPEEFTLGAGIDEVSNVYCMGGAAYALFANREREREKWDAHCALYDVAARAVSADRDVRYQSIHELKCAWDTAKSAEVAIRELTKEDIRPDMLAHFNRYQEVEQAWRGRGGIWAVEDIAYTERWDDAYKAHIIEDFAECLTHGRAYGAFDGDALIGFAFYDGRPMGSQGQYLWLVMMHVSYGYRGEGLGKRLFLRCAEAARADGARKLYISASSAVHTQAFYGAMGCVEASEIDAKLAAAEPCDVQMEFAV